MEMTRIADDFSDIRSRTEEPSRPDGTDKILIIQASFPDMPEYQWERTLHDLAQAMRRAGTRSWSWRRTR